ncbi:MAG: hypothetical protein KDI78_01645 [Xanthomonadales bacterium]|nr:hypothetical protein [Xanthomonadales bacterium]
MKHMFQRVQNRLLLALSATMLASCASAPSSAPEAVDPPTVEQKRELLDELDELTAAAKDDSILDVAPLRDNNAHDWLSEARAAFAEKRYADSRRAIKEGLALSPEDPELLQLRAELDLLAGEWKTASLGAYRAWQHSAKVGPLCRRQWATIALARRERGSIEASQRALDQMARCRVEPLPRF